MQRVALAKRCFAEPGPHKHQTVMAGLDPAIHLPSKDCCEDGWMRGSSPRMTKIVSVTAPALQRTAPRRAARCAASGARKLARRSQPLFREQPHRGVGVHRLAEGKALRVFAAELVEL